MARRRKRRHDATGRTIRGEKFSKLFLATMQTPAWHALTPHAQRLYPWLVLELQRGAANNGTVALTVQQAKERLGCHSETARRALHDLQRKGFVVVTRCAVLGTEGEARSHLYELTEYGRPPATRPRRCYLDWKPGREFDVIAAAAHNPTGRGGFKSKNQTYRLGSAQPTEPSTLNLQNRKNGAKTGRFPTYALGHPYYQGVWGGTAACGPGCRAYHHLVIPEQRRARRAGVAG